MDTEFTYERERDEMILSASPASFPRVIWYLDSLDMSDLGGVDARNEARVYSALSDVVIDALLIIPKFVVKRLVCTLLLLGTKALVLLKKVNATEMIESLTIKW